MSAVHYDFSALASQLLAQSREILPNWFPNGRQTGREFRVGNLRGDPGDSLSVNTETGMWADFATEEKGGDLIALYAAKNSVSQFEAARDLGGAGAIPSRTNGHAPATMNPEQVLQAASEPNEETPVLPAPAHAEPPGLKHPRYGRSTGQWAYRDAEGLILCWVYRFDPEGSRKQFVPYRWLAGAWVAKAPSRPRPLYGLDGLAAKPTARVLICEGEKATDAAQKKLTGMVCMCWMGGAAAVNTADWSVLQGRTVVLWPDADNPGRQAGAKIAGYLLSLKCPIEFVDTTGQPDGWDAADWDGDVAWVKSRLRSAARAVDVNPQGAIAGVVPFVATHDSSYSEKEYSAVTTLEPGGVTSRRSDIGHTACADVSAVLRMDRAGPIRDEENIRLILERDLRLTGIVRFNEFSGEMHLQRPIQSDSSVVGDRTTPRRWNDSDTVSLTTYIQRTTLPKVARDKVEATVAFFARERCAYHPLRDYLQGLKWDGTERVITWLYEYLGVGSAQPAEYLTSVGRAFMVSAVARVLDPGCQADCALVLEGTQGIGKSSALRILAGDEWFSDSLPSDLKHKDAKDHLRGKWIIELPELAQFKRNEIETVKAFLSRRHEQYRPSYGRHEISYPRQCVFVGSTNENEYLVDVTGNRRFWCVACGTLDLDALLRDRDQLWAEAVSLYLQGTPWHLTGEVAHFASIEAQSRVTVDPWKALVEGVLQSVLVVQGDVTPGEVMDRIDLTTEQKHARNAGRVGTILRELGWERGKRDRTRGQLYRRPTA